MEPVNSFKDGAPFDMCKYKGNAFHTAKYNLQYVRWIQPMEDFNKPSPYKLTVDKLTYREFVHRTINGKKMATSDMIKVTLSVIPGFKIDHFKGFYIKAIPFDRTEKDPRAYGTFALVHDNGKFVVKNKQAETVLCYVLHWYSDVFPIGGVSHIDSDNKTEVTVYWFPPKSCDIGKIRFE
ncbi:hypothetical protein KUTeg_001934 [Tegillarca granosa]|uniref:Reelin domain-containing protein n=1 Tax=Tegillarca granosa TaxID=220873 RepID=A0ABQ9FSW2_TEGGR|nr:hypothetical protein KUTeg_001934 [Tegillarca granosa]